MTFYEDNFSVLAKRFLAYLIDSFLCLFASIFLIAIIGIAFQFTEGGPGYILYFFYAFYYIFMFGKYGQTFGYKVFKLKIQKEDGSSVDYKFALYRLFATALSSLIFCVGHLMILFNAKKQALHDSLTNIVVVEL